MMDLFLLASMLTLSVLPVIAPIACVYTGIDCVQILLKNSFFAFGIHRSIFVTFFQTLTSFIIINLACIDTARALALLLYCLFILLERACSSIKLLLNTLDISNPKITYVPFYLCFMSILKRDLERLAYIWLYTLFWMTVAASWIVITKSPKDISYLMYVTIASVPLCVVIFGYAVFPLVCSFLEDSSRFVAIQQFSCTLTCSMHPLRANRCRKLEMRALRPIQLRYGEFQQIGREFLVDYVWNIVLRIFDVILIADFWKCWTQLISKLQLFNCICKYL